MPNYDQRLEFDLADRLRRALRVADVGVQEMAQELEVHATTVGNWINGRTIPRRRDLRLFAMKTGFPLEWLETGKAPIPDGDEGLESRLGESNPRPIHYE